MSAPEEMTLKVIAHIRTAFPTKFGIPRQSGLVDSLRGEVIFTPEVYDRETVYKQEVIVETYHQRIGLYRPPAVFILLHFIFFAAYVYLQAFYVR